MPEDNQVTAHEHQQEPPLVMSDNDAKAQAWLRGYSDGYQGRDEHMPAGFRVEYLRGYVAGLKALKN